MTTPTAIGGRSGPSRLPRPAKPITCDKQCGVTTPDASCWPDNESAPRAPTACQDVVVSDAGDLHSMAKNATEMVTVALCRGLPPQVGASRVGVGHEGQLHVVNLCSRTCRGQRSLARRHART